MPMTLTVRLPFLHPPVTAGPHVRRPARRRVPRPRRQCLSCRQQVHYYTKQTISVGVYGRNSLRAIKRVRLYLFVLKVQNVLQATEERALVLICQDQVGLLTRLRLT